MADIDESDAGPRTRASAAAAGASGVDAAAGREASAGTGGAAGSAGNTTAGSAPLPGCTPAPDAKTPERLTTKSPVRAQDPAAIVQDAEVFLFATGPGLSIKRSTDLSTWRDAGSVFTWTPAWIAMQVPGATELSAPDVARWNDKLHVYYGVLTPGSHRACIGHAIADKASGPFTDKGSVICSSEMDDWNAADPSVVQDAGKQYLVLGSFWSGIKLIELNQDGARAGDTLVALAARPKSGNAVSAPNIVQHCGHYYLFVSFDRCCDGANSTSQIMVGRADQLTGPYLDKKGVRMLDGGGSLVVAGDDSWRGPGQSSVLVREDRSYELHHAYFAGMSSWPMEHGAAYLRISELSWDKDGWPASGGP